MRFLNLISTEGSLRNDVWGRTRKKKTLLFIVLFIQFSPLFFSLFLFLFPNFSSAFIIPACSYKFFFSLFKKNNTSNTWIHFCCKNSNRKLKSCLMRTLSFICPCLVHAFPDFYLYTFSSLPPISSFLLCVSNCICFM